MTKVNADVPYKDFQGQDIPVRYVSVNATADGDNTIISGVTGEEILVLGYVLSVTLAGQVTIQDTAATPVVFGRLQLLAGTPIAYAGGIRAPAFRTAVGAGVEINNPTGVDTVGHMTYVQLKRAQ